MVKKEEEKEKEEKKVEKTKKRAKKKEGIPSMTVNVYSLKGKIMKKIKLPTVFMEEFRPDLIRRAVTASQSHRRQPYGPSEKAGMRHSVRWSGKGHGVSRVPRLMLDRSTGAQAPGTVGGRRAHPPRPEKIWYKKINEKERRKARKSALSATTEKDIVTRRGHKFNNKLTLPLVIEDKLEKIEATKDVITTLEAIGVYDDILRAKIGKHIRAGKGKMRGRKYRTPKSLLIVVSKTENIRRGIGNIPGIDITTPSMLSTELLAPGGDPGRLTIFTLSAIEQLKEW